MSRKIVILLQNIGAARAIRLLGYIYIIICLYTFITTSYSDPKSVVSVFAKYVS